MMQTATPVRHKITFPPPVVCDSCYWQRRYQLLLFYHKRLQRDLIKQRLDERKISKQLPKQRDEVDHDPEVADLVDEMRKHGCE